MKMTLNKISLLSLIALLSLVTLTPACSKKNEEARAALEEHLKNFNPKSIEIDIFHTDSNFPDKAYVSATVTYNYATAEGTLQKEYLGYILKKEGDSWKVAENTRYTKDPSKAVTYLSGKKG